VIVDGVGNAYARRDQRVADRRRSLRPGRADLLRTAL
jgi:hypothetical protein